MPTLRRRIVTIPVVVLLAALVLGTLPATLTVAVLVDLFRYLRRKTPFAVTRLLLFGAVYLLAEVVGLLALCGAWVGSGFGASRSRLIAWTYAIQSAWVATLFNTVRNLYRVRFEVDDDALGPAPGGPVLVLMQHTSLVDTLLPTTFLTRRRGLALRWVLKSELLVDPCLDVAGLRLPNAFVRRDGTDTAQSLARVAALARDLGPRDGVLIYPEGTRFTPSKRRRALDRLATSQPALLPRAERLQRVLPPRLGGPLALMEAAPEADLVFFAHHGFEGLATVAAVLSGELVGKTVRLRFWRHARAEVPVDRQERIAWLWSRWEEVDAWVTDASQPNNDA
ncbi:MAG: lysophospholipid acyltransferase family protein [Deltaproteobacteria bacterium]|nr:lysophospholipid acyltransferase family protein [Deltaproteobacteria bacterium]